MGPVFPELLRKEYLRDFSLSPLLHNFTVVDVAMGLCKVIFRQSIGTINLENCLRIFLILPEPENFKGNSQNLAKVIYPRSINVENLVYKENEIRGSCGEAIFEGKLAENFSEVKEI